MYGSATPPYHPWKANFQYPHNFLLKLRNISQSLTIPYRPEKYIAKTIVISHFNEFMETVHTRYH